MDYKKAEIDTIKKIFRESALEEIETLKTALNFSALENQLAGVNDTLKEGASRYLELKDIVLKFDVERVKAALNTIPYDDKINSLVLDLKSIVHNTSTTLPSLPDIQLKLIAIFNAYVGPNIPSVDQVNVFKNFWRTANGHFSETVKMLEDPEKNWLNRTFQQALEDSGIFGQLEELKGLETALSIAPTEYLSVKLNKLKNLELQVRNRIHLEGQKIAYTVEQAKDEFKEEIDTKLSALETEYMTFRGTITQAIEARFDGVKAEMKIAEMLAEFASVPALHEAQVKIEHINKLVNEELPVRISYAKPYLDTIANSSKEILDFNANAGKVFAEIKQDSQFLLQGKIRNISKDMGGLINPEMPAQYLTFLQSQANKTKNDVLNSLGYKELAEQATAAKNLIMMGNSALDEMVSNASISPKTFFDGLRAKILGDIELKDILGFKFNVPNTVIRDNQVVYTFATDDIQNKTIGFLTFDAKRQANPTRLLVHFEKSLTSSTFKSVTSLTDFTLRLFETMLVIAVTKIEILNDNNKKDFNVKIDKVSFGGALNFLGVLAEKIKMPGTGLRVNTTDSKIAVGYSFALPSIESPSFNLSNVKFDVGLNVDLPTRTEVPPMTSEFSINSPDDKFLVSVGIFGGRGHFVLKATPQKITHVDVALEFGGYLGLNLGIAKGYAFLFAGIRYYKSGDVIAFSAYIVCGGGVTVFGFISVSVLFRMELTYQKVKNQESFFGTAAVRYSIKIGFLKKSFTLSYQKRIVGSGGKQVNDSTAYLDKPSPDQYYASILPIPPTLLEESEEIQVDKKSPKKIYNEESWSVYCNSFSL